MDKAKPSLTLFQWVWKAYFKASLLPLLILEISLISVYFFSNQFSNRENIHALYELAEHELTHLAAREANGINHQLDAVSNATQYLQDFAAKVMSGKQVLPKDDPARFAYSSDGVYYTNQDTGGSAVFYSGFTPIGKREREKAWASAALDPALLGIKNSFPLVAQTYINTYDSLNRIYPYFDVIKQYPPKMNIPSFNFYYEADARHNPKRGTVWTDVYVDPAGQGWMLSCIAPVYNVTKPDFLEGVVGVDVTIKDIVEEVKKLEIPWQGYGVLISRSGTILALPNAVERDWGIQNLIQTDYSSAIKQDTFRAEEFNVYLKPAIASSVKNTAQGFQKVSLARDSLLAWATIPRTGWKIMIVAPEVYILKTAKTLASRLNQIALLMLVGMLVFYIIFFWVLYRRTIKMSLSISEPLKTIDAIVADIAAGLPVIEQCEFVVTELNSTATGILSMGRQLESAKQAQAEAADELCKKTEQLQVIFDVSPSGYVLVNDNNEIILCNNAFSHLLGISKEELVAMKERGFWQRLSEQVKDVTHLSTISRRIQRIEVMRPRPASLLFGIKEIFLPQSGVLGKVYFFHDITKDEEIDRIKNDFLTHATHELATPLASILGYSELLLASKIPAAMQPEIFTLIHSQSSHLVKMIYELLDLTKIAERAGLDFTIVPTSLADIIKEVITEFPIPRNRNPIRFEQPDFTVTIHADHAKFKQVLQNIFDNAYKFSTEGEVTVRVKIRPDLQNVSIEIADSGIGMSQEEQAQAFERFYRAEKSGNIPGTGLGLSLAKEIMTLLNGKIEFDSKLGVGTQVKIVMPVVLND